MSCMVSIFNLKHTYLFHKGKIKFIKVSLPIQSQQLVKDQII